MTVTGEIVDLKRRALSLERRLRDMKPLKYLHQLLDVDITYDGPGSVSDSDVLTYDASAERWVAASGSGVYSTASVAGDDSPWSELRWAVASSPGLVMTANAADDGLTATAAGIYSVEVTSESTASYELRVYGPNWQWTGEDPPACRTNGVIYEQSAGTSGDPMGGSGAIQMALPAGGQMQVQVLAATDPVHWVLTAHLVAVLDIDDGTCG